MSWTIDPYITAQIVLMSRLYIFLLLLNKMTPQSGQPVCSAQVIPTATFVQHRVRDNGLRGGR